MLGEINLSSAHVQQFGDANEFLIRFESLQSGTEQEINEQIQSTILSVRGKN